MYAKGISQQGKKIYELLLNEGALSSDKIADKLQIKHQAVYRQMEYLVETGFVEEISGWPKRIKALSPGQAKERYSMFYQEKIAKMFDTLIISKVVHEQSFSFLSGREKIFDNVSEDLNNAKYTANFIVLGLPIGISPELLLAQRYAAIRGVKIKIIAQEHSQENKDTLHSWKQQGLNIRLGKPIGFHLLLIDNDISYLMYYDRKDKTKRNAVRIVHPGINTQLQETFESHWKVATSFN